MVLPSMFTEQLIMLVELLTLYVPAVTYLNLSLTYLMWAYQITDCYYGMLPYTDLCPYMYQHFKGAGVRLTLTPFSTIYENPNSAMSQCFPSWMVMQWLHFMITPSLQ